MNAEKREAAWTVVASHALSLSERAHGLASGSTEIGKIADRGLVSMLGEHCARAGIRALSQLVGEPIVLVETDACFESAGGVVEVASSLRPDMGPQDRILDGRSGLAWGCWRVDHARTRVRVEKGSVYIDTTGLPLEAWLPPPPLEIDEPDVEPALKRWTAPAWLGTQVRAYSRGSPLQRVTALALFARYVTLSPDEALADETPWSSAVAAWRQRAAPVREALFERAMAAAEGLEHQLDEIQSIVAARHPAAAARVRLWVYERDDLESLSLLGQKAREQGSAWDSFTRCLATLDEWAEAASSPFADIMGPSDDRLAALSWHDPAAWWGRLA